MGVVTSLTIKKGGSEDLWSKDNLPIEMEVTLSIKDLYPTLMLSQSYSMLYTNMGLANFLDNMAGIAVSDIKVSSEINSWLASKINAVAGAETSLYNAANNVWVKNVTDKANSSWIRKLLKPND